MKILLLVIIGIIWAITYFRKPKVYSPSIKGFIKSRGLNILAFASFVFVEFFM